MREIERRKLYWILNDRELERRREERDRRELLWFIALGLISAVGAFLISHGG